MEDIIAPISRGLLEQELNEKTFLRYTNKGGNELYVVNGQTSPNTLLEIGRLRELAFRDSGGGTGLACDLDDYDRGDHAYQQLIVWDPDAKEIIGGYRYIKCKDAIDAEGNIHLSTTHYFDFSEQFVKDYLPTTIELGRSFVQPKYQGKEGGKKALFSLDNLWDGLGALVVLNPDIEYFFGKVTMYKSFDLVARDHILAFMRSRFPDKDGLLSSKPELLESVKTEVAGFLREIEHMDYKAAYNTLSNYVRSRGEAVPPLINSYMGLSSTMRTFDTANNPDFGDVEETCILVSIKDIYPEKSERHIKSFEAK
ncbi:MAG: hemolysin [Bacteroidetes bacterium 43-16]|nr:MAG: hemolysin [Bacteroidetes bacterium 43-16]